MRTERRPALALLAGLAVLALAALASLAVGAGPVGAADLLDALRGAPTPEELATLGGVRVPRTLLAVAVGVALGVSGLLVQVVTRNPLAEPGLLGVTYGAGFAITLGVVAGADRSPPVQLLLALVGAVLAAAGVAAVGWASPLRLVLAGTAMTLVLGGLTLAMRLAAPDVFDRYRFWTVGSLAGREQAPLTVPLVAAVLGVVAVVPLLRHLGTLALGDQVAHALGTRVTVLRVTAFALVALLAAAATAAVGPISFVGLMVPQLALFLARGSLPLAFAHVLLIGPVLLLVADVLARVALPTGELPVAVVTAFLGGPVLIWAVRRFAGETA